MNEAIMHETMINEEPMHFSCKKWTIQSCSSGKRDGRNDHFYVCMQMHESCNVIHP